MDIESNVDNIYDEADYWLYAFCVKVNTSP